MTLSMRNLGLGDILLALRNLATERKDDVLLSGTGRIYAPKLGKLQVQIETLPEAARGGRPLALQLGNKDEEHDGFGEAIYYYTEAVLHLPSSTTAQKEAAHRIRDAFVPTLSTLRASYADEAAAAVRKRHALDMLRSDLETFPVPTGGTLLDWATSFVDAGDAIDKLLHSRSLIGNDGMSAPAIRLRAMTLGILSRFRAVLADEIEEDLSLPRDLEKRIFSYLDELHAMREQAGAGRTKPKSASEPESNST